jgi:hypothetical protein
LYGIELNEKLEIGSWKLETGKWKLETRAANVHFLISSFCFLVFRRRNGQNHAGCHFYAAHPKSSRSLLAGGISSTILAPKRTRFISSSDPSRLSIRRSAFDPPD